VNLLENRGAWRSYTACFRNHRLSLFLLTVAGLGQSFAWVPGAAILRRIFDQILPAGIPAGAPGPIAGTLGPFWIAVAELMGLQLAGLLLAWWIRITALRLSQDVLATLRTRAIEHYYRLPRIFHTQADVERLHLTLVHETGVIDTMNNAATTQMLPSIGGALVLFWILVRIEPLYAVVLALAAPALFTLNRMTERHAWLRQERVRAAWEKFSRGVRFMIQALDLTRSHAAEEFEISRQTRSIRELRGISLELNRFDASQQVLQGFLLMTCTLVALLAGGWSIAAGQTTRGQVMVFYVMAALFAVQARTIVESVPPMRRGIRSFGELDALLRIPEREPYQGALAVATIESLRMEDAWFRYRDDAPVLSGAAFEIRRGEQVAMVGANGAGKSTVVHLITGLYKPARGGLFVNGVAYEEVNIRSLRERMAILPQNPFLFPGTIRDNLTYGSTAYRDGAMRQALEWAGAGAFVDELAAGLDAEIGEQGILLSGGQRQKLVLARALLREPDFLIFDEPTNHLDEEAITTLLHNLSRLPFRPAVLMISHDPTALRHASRAWRLEGGCLREAALETRC
jgi:ATP-binding cassette, subfamily B, bacterial